MGNRRLSRVVDDKSLLHSLTQVVSVIAWMASTDAEEGLYSAQFADGM